MANKRLELHGVRFGLLTGVKPVGATTEGLIIWRFVCDCGEHVDRVGSNIRRDHKKGVVSSCGCTSPLLVHGLSKKFSKLHRVWVAMRQRCNNPNNKDYSNYGGRGIKVCNQWNDFRLFHTWALSAGYKPGVTIERINVNDGYNPKNCTWIENKKQALNTRKIVTLDFNGESLTLRQLSEKIGVNIYTLKSRRASGWTTEQIIRGHR